MVGDSEEQCWILGSVHEAVSLVCWGKVLLSTCLLRQFGIKKNHPRSMMNGTASGASGHRRSPREEFTSHSDVWAMWKMIPS